MCFWGNLLEARNNKKNNIVFMKTPLISVIMPVYNSGSYLDTAVMSILNQSFQDFELILVDDGSVDGSSRKCDEYAEKDNRIIVIHQRNGGICNARNHALRIAKGDYVAFSDHDDEYLPGLLECAYNRAIEDNADIVKFGKKELILVDDKLQRIRETSIENRTFYDTEISNNYFNLLNAKILDCIWDCLIKREIIITNNVFFDEKYKVGGEDIAFITNLLQYVKSLALINKVFYLHYIRHGFSTSSKFNPYKIETEKMLARDITYGAKNLGINIADYKAEYTYQMTYTLFNDVFTLVSNQECNKTWKDKVSILDQLRIETYLPSWIFSQNIFSIWKISKKYALCYYFFKHRIYMGMEILRQIRKASLRLVVFLRSEYK